MPKPNYNNKHWIRDNDERISDNRDRRVAFKQGRNFKNKNRDLSSAVREYLVDEDIDMGLGGGSGKNIRRSGGKKGRHGGGEPIHKRKLLEGPTGWYKILIPYGEKYEKSFLQKLLLDKLAPLPFLPVAWQSSGTAVVFYVDDYKTADKLLSLSHQVQLPNGFKLIVKVHPGSPAVDITPQLKEKMKLVMAKRYNSLNKALDLTKFHADPDLKNDFCALFKPQILIAVLDIIGNEIPDLEALSLNDNRLMFLEGMKKSINKLNNVKIFHLRNNKLRDISVLDGLSDMPIVDLVLDGNPLCDKFKEQSSYISAVRKVFPKCIRLDEVDLPPPISFDIAEEINVPETQKTFLCSLEGEPIIRQFLEQYYLIYDTENRQPLLQAYHENAVFSYTMCHPSGSLGKDKNSAWLNWYQTDNRNLLKVSDSDRRTKLLRQGQLSVVSFLQEMPLSKHDIHSFTIDLTLFTPTMICLTISGMFKELKSGHKVPPIRYFFRTLVIVPVGSGFCISNDELHITNATANQAKEAFKTPSLPSPLPGTAAPPSTPVASPVIQPVAAGIPTILDEATKQELVKQVALQTGMNWEFSTQCLDGNNWNLAEASAAFQKLQSQGSIPPEAFIK
ncbi:hypothetical protein GWI33_015302 [Rhynchophorus ferrugineus]|uniref:Nuclear RNA export factor 1 n=1 Tax=Rhynchophorus ferrugineus TaxID=354439 RepID=A0A834I5B9_RHYFE|nr:hypothetical protein GWI33_015302 [Rhynchophorus ferrugineus]